MLINNAFADSVIYKAVRFELRSHLLSQSFGPRAFLRENMRIFVNEKKERIRYLLVVITLNINQNTWSKIINNHFYEYNFFYNCNQSKHMICMKTKINIVVDLSSVDKIDTRQFLFNRTIVVGSFSMCYWSTFPLIHSK